MAFKKNLQDFREIIQWYEKLAWYSVKKKSIPKSINWSPFLHNVIFSTLEAQGSKDNYIQGRWKLCENSALLTALLQELFIVPCVVCVQQIFTE